MSQVPVMENIILEQFSSLYPGRRPNEAVLYVENKAILPHADPPVYAELLDRFVSPEEAVKQECISAELWRKADAEKDKLFALVEQVQKKLADKSKGSAPMKVNLKNCKWEEVIDEVKETGNRWRTRPSRTVTAQRCLEKLGQHQGTLQAWLGLLPAGDYGSSVCGAFKLAIGAASQYAKTEDCIFEALGDIPEAMENARRYVSIYEDVRDHFLERKTFDLYLSVLTALNHIMQFFADPSIVKVFGTLGKQSAYKMDLFKSVEEVKKHTVKIKEEAQQCLAERSARMDRKMMGIHKTMMETLKTADETHRFVQRLYCFLRNHPTLKRGCAPTALESDPQQQTAIGNVSREAIRDSTSNTKAAKNLLRMLKYDSNVPAEDLATCLQICDSLDEQSKARAAAMIQSDRFRTWLVEDTSSRSLLVNGHVDLEAAEGPSPLSLVDAEIVRYSEVEAGPAVSFVVNYLCGLHRQNMDPSVSSSSVGMMASLVGQLLTQMLDKGVAVDVSFLDKTGLKNVENYDLLTLCTVFRLLAMQLPAKALLVCVLDEVSFYETRNLGRDTDAVMRRLTRLVANSTEILFKLLVTCRGQALDFQQYFDPSDILDLDEDVDLDDSAMWKIKNIGSSD